LAYNLTHECIASQGNNNTGDASRSLWECIWSAPVPTKVRIFGWRLVADNLATKNNKWRRNLETINTCSICGTETKNSYHATMSCTKARALRHMMRNLWNIPKESDFRFTWNDWLLVLLSNRSKTEQGLILLLLWRAWHLRNNAIHEDGMLVFYPGLLRAELDQNKNKQFHVREKRQAKTNLVVHTIAPFLFFSRVLIGILHSRLHVQHERQSEPNTT
jgi:hypothetical protein